MVNVMPVVWSSRTLRLLTSLRGVFGRSVPGFVDGHLVAFGDLAADVERDPLTVRDPRSKLNHVSVVPSNSDLAERHAAAVIDDGNLRAARAKYQRRSRYLDQIVSLKLERDIDVHSRNQRLV